MKRQRHDHDPELTTPVAARQLSSRSRRLSSVAASLAVTALVLGACGGDDDESSDTTPLAVATTTVAAPAPTAAPTTAVPATTPPTTIAFVTEGATVMVANASSINGAAGRMTDALAVAGFTTGDPANSTEGQLEITKVYYDASDDAAEAVAQSVREALGGGDITVEESGTPPPVDTGDWGDASVLVAMGNDTVDKTLEELQGLVVATPDEGDDTTETTEGDDTTETTEG